MVSHETERLEALFAGELAKRMEPMARRVRAIAERRRRRVRAARAAVVTTVLIVTALLTLPWSRPDGRARFLATLPAAVEIVDAGAPKRPIELTAGAAVSDPLRLPGGHTLRFDVAARVLLALTKQQEEAMQADSRVRNVGRMGGCVIALLSGSVTLLPSSGQARVLSMTGPASSALRVPFSAPGPLRASLKPRVPSGRPAAPPEDGTVVSGYLRDEGTGAGIRGYVRLGYGEDPKRVPETGGWSADDGSFSLRYEDQRNLVAFADGYLPGGLPLDVSQVEAGRPLEIRLVRDTLTRTFEVEVEDAQGNRCAGAGRIYFTAHERVPCPGEAKLFDPSPETRLRAAFGCYNGTRVLLADGLDHGPDRDPETGALIVRYLDEGSYRVRVFMESGSEVSMGEVSVPPEGGRLVLRLPAPTGIAGVIEGGSDRFRGTVVSIWGPTDAPRPNRYFAGHVGSDGTFKAVALPPGVLLRFQIERAGETRVLLDRFTLAEGEYRSNLSFPFPFEDEEAEVPTDGIVRDAVDGKPLPGVTVSAPASAGGSAKAVTNRQGGFHLSGILKYSLRVSARREGYYDLERVYQRLPDNLELYLVPDDEGRLLQSGAFTRLEVRLDNGNQELPAARTLELEAFSSDGSWHRMREISGERLGATAAGWSGLLPAPRSLVLDAPVSWSAPRRVRALVRCPEAKLSGEAEEEIRPGGVTRLAIDLRPTGDVALVLVDAVGGGRLPVDQAMARLVGRTAIDLRRDAEGRWNAVAVPAGRYRVDARFDESRGWYECRGREVTVHEGSREDVSLEALLHLSVVVHVYRPDGSEWLPPGALPGEDGWVLPDDPDPPRALVDPPEVRAFGERFPVGGIRSISVRPDRRDPDQRPRRWYTLDLPWGQTYTIHVEGDGLRSETNVITVTQDLQEVSFHLESTE